MARIVIDAGHGGEDTGALSNDGTITESSMNLLYATELNNRIFINLLASPILTRFDDSYITLQQRCDIANKARADAFISIHFNSCSEPNTARGFEAFYFPDSGNGKELAKCIHEHWKDGHGIGYTRGIKKSSFLTVLNRTNMPAVLLELGFMNNDEELQIMQNIFWMNTSINSLVNGIEHWVDKNGLW